MGIKQVVQDDMTGETLPDDTKPTTIKIGNDTYDVYLSDDSLSKLVTMLNGDAPLTTVETTYRSGRKASSRGRAKVNTYGLDFTTVRTWAVKNQVKAKSGKPITDATRVLNQDVYDKYKAAVK